MPLGLSKCPCYGHSRLIFRAVSVLRSLVSDLLSVSRVDRAQVLQLSVLLWSSRVSRSLALAAVLRLSAWFIDSLLVEAAQLIRDSASFFLHFEHPVLFSSHQIKGLSFSNLHYVFIVVS
jgi:hypothetical protein